MWKGSLTLTRPTANDFVQTREEFMSRVESIFGQVMEGKLKLAIAKTFPLKEAAEAHRFLECKYCKGTFLTFCSEKSCWKNSSCSVNKIDLS